MLNWEEEELKAASALSEAIETARVILQQPSSHIHIHRAATKPVPAGDGGTSPSPSGTTAGAADRGGITPDQIETMRKAHQRRLTGVTGQLKKAERERDDALNALAKLRLEVDKMRTEHQQQTLLRNAEDEGTTVDLQKKLSIVEGNEKRLREAVTELTQQNKVHVGHIADLEATLAQVSDDERVKTLRAQISDLTNDAIRREKSMSTKDQIITELRSKYAEQADLLGQKESESEALKSQVMNLQAELKAVGATLEVKIAALNQAEQQRADLRSKLLELQLSTDETIAVLRHQLKEVEDKVGTQSKELNQFRALTDQLREQVKVKMEAEQNLKRNVEELQSTVESSARQISTIQQRSVRSQLRSALGGCRYAYFHKWRVWALSKLNAREQLKHSATQSLLAAARTNASKVQADAEAAERALQERCDQLEAKLAEVNLQSTKKREQWQHENAELKRQVEALQTQLDTAKSEADNLRSKHQQELKKWQTQLSEIAHKESTARHENEDLRTELAETRSQLQEADERQRRLESQGKMSEAELVSYWKDRVAALEETEVRLRNDLAEARTHQRRTPTPDLAATQREEAERQALLDQQAAAEGAAAEMRHAIDGLFVERSKSAKDLQVMLQNLEESHRLTALQYESRVQDLEKRNADLVAAAQSTSTLERSKEQELLRLRKENEAARAEVARLHAEIGQQSKPQKPKVAPEYGRMKAALLCKRVGIAFGQRVFASWVRFALLQRVGAVRKMAQRSLKALQTKADTVKGIADEAVSRNALLEAKIRQLEAELAGSPRRVPRTDPTTIDLQDGESQTDGLTELEESNRRADHLAAKVKELTRLMETARLQVNSIVQELHVQKAREAEFIGEAKQLNAELAIKDSEIAKYKAELRKALTRFSDAAMTEQSEFASWLVTTRSSLVRDLVQLWVICKEFGGDAERGAKHMVQKYLTDPEKHHHGIGVGFSQIREPPE
jgi:predicted  nucleic acid-binding Zn-ribbon protein